LSFGDDTQDLLPFVAAFTHVIHQSSRHALVDRVAGILAIHEGSSLRLEVASAGRFEPFDQAGNPVVNPLQPLMSDNSMAALINDGSFLSNVPIPSFNTDGPSLDPTAYSLSPEDLAATHRLEAAVRTNTTRLFESAGAGGGPAGSAAAAAAAAAAATAAGAEGGCSQADQIGSLGMPSLSDIANLMNLNNFSSMGGSFGSFGLSGQRSVEGAGPGGDFDPLPANDAPPRSSKRQMSNREQDDNDPALHTRMDVNSAATSGRHVRPAAAGDGESRLSVSPHGMASGGGGGFVPQWLAAEAATGGGLSSEEGLGMTQLDAYNWTIEEYNNTGLQRALQRQDYQALLSLAGAAIACSLLQEVVSKHGISKCAQMPCVYLFLACLHHQMQCIDSTGRLKRATAPGSSGCCSGRTTRRSSPSQVWRLLLVLQEIVRARDMSNVIFVSGIFASSKNIAWTPQHGAPADAARTIAAGCGRTTRRFSLSQVWRRLQPVA
jgi:hypothetical protein